MKTKLLILTFLSCFVSYLTFAQEVPRELIDRANSVDYIFEGKVIESTPYYSDNGRYIRTSNTVLITKILKGDIGCGTVEIITNGGQINNSRLEISHSLQLGKGNMGIFLCDLTDRPVSVIDFYPETNLQALEGSFENQSFIRYWWDGYNMNAADFTINFDSLATIYNLTELITGLNYTNCFEASNSPIDNYIETQQVQYKISASIPMLIDSFTPHNVRGGVSDTVTIYGSGFGSNQGSGNIYLNDGDNGGQSQVHLDSNEVFWSDTEIKFIVPSYSTSNCTTCDTVVGRPAATGRIKIINNSGDSIFTSTDLKIRFSVYNSEEKEPYVTAPWSIMDEKFTFHCDSLIANYDNGKMKIVLEKAIQDWICLTGVDWEMGSDTVYTEVDPMQDKSCIIHFKDFPNNVATLMATAARRDFSYSSNFLDKSFAIYEVDMILNSDHTYHCDTNQSNTTVPNGKYDFYTIALHEFGHALGLNHVIDGGAIMHYSVSQSTRKTDLPNDSSCDEGGNWMADYTNDTSNPQYSTLFDRMSFDENNPCSNNLSLIDLFVSETIDINISPNPCSNVLNIHIENDQNDIHIEVYDLQGRKQIIEQDNLKNIFVGNLQSGVYVLRVIKDNYGLISTAKFIKQ